MVLAFSFYARNLDSFGTRIYIFIFPGMEPKESNDASALSHKYDAVLGRANQRLFVESTRLFQ